ncbi:MAG: site-specific DNA-methyltransferase [FCB group bacterium]|nr:site-specific DNA-methyltransferase [FCB group bacterium]
MPTSQKDWITGASPEATPSINGLTIDELNRYLPALQQAADLRNAELELREGVFQADALSGLSGLPEEKIDLLIVQPPENPVAALNESRAETTWQKLYEWHRGWLQACRRVLKPSGFLFLFCDWPQSGMYHSLLVNYFFIQTRITWRRPRSTEPSPAGFLVNQSGDIWVGTPSRVPGVPSGESPPGTNFWSDVVDWHLGAGPETPNLIPEPVLERILHLSTTKLGWVVDPFMGAGQTGIVAKKLGRRFIGFEQDQDQCLLAMKRIDQA